MNFIKALFVICLSSWCYSQELFHIAPDKSYKTKQADLDLFGDPKNPAFKAGIPYRTSNHGAVTIYNWQFPNEMTSDGDLGFVQNPEAQIRHIARTENEVVYDAIYTFDRYSRRITPVKKTASYDKFITLFGCSYAYGNALNDDQTINYNIAVQNKEFYPYNYAIGATGINSTLALVQKTDFSSQIPEKIGLFVEVYIGAHVDRAAGSLPSLQWLQYTPFYAVTADDKVERRGSFRTGRPIYNFIMQLVARLFGSNILSGRIFPSLTADDYTYYCRLAEEVRDTLKNKSPKSEFVIYVHPLERLDPGLKSCFISRQIKFIEPVPLNPNEYKIKYDGHPSAKANERIAKDLIDFAEKEF